MARYAFQVILLLVVAAYAWRRGEWPERAAASALVAMFAVDRAYHAVFESPQFRQLDLWHLTLDLVMLAAIAGLALRAPRVWLLWLASLQLISALGHFLRILDMRMPEIIYWAMTSAPSYLQILLLAAGTYLNDRRAVNRLRT